MIPVAPFMLIVGVVVSMVNVAHVEFHAKSVTIKIFVHSLVIGSPLLYGASLMVAPDI